MNWSQDVSLKLRVEEETKEGMRELLPWTGLDWTALYIPPSAINTETRIIPRDILSPFTKFWKAFVPLIEIFKGLRSFLSVIWRDYRALPVITLGIIFPNECLTSVGPRVLSRVEPSSAIIVRLPTRGKKQ